MRILMISDVYFPRVNGVSTSIQTFRNEMLALGHEVTLIVPSYGPDDSTDADIIRVPARVVPMDPEDRLMSRSAILKLGASLKARAFDVVHIHTPFVAHYAGIALARRLDCPVVETYHTYFEEYLHHYARVLPRAVTRSLARLFSRSQCNQVDAVVVPSSAMQAVLRGYGVNARMEIIPTGLDLARFDGGDGDRFRARHGIAPERPTLVHVGRVAHEKNIDFILHMLRRVANMLPETLLIIAGEGPAREHLGALVSELGLDDNVLFVGNLERGSELLDCYKAGDVMVFASKTETQGLVLLEAMALGVPLVALSELGARDILDAELGVLIAQESVVDFSDKVLRLLRDRELRRQLGMEGMSCAMTWSSGRLAVRMLDLYARLAEATAQQPADRLTVAPESSDA